MPSASSHPHDAIEAKTCVYDQQPRIKPSKKTNINEYLHQSKIYTKKEKEQKAV
jgi:hypothetical protein